MITKTNYFSEINKVGLENLPKLMQEMHELIGELTESGSDWSTYDEDKEVQNDVNVQFTKLDEWIQKNSSADLGPKTSKTEQIEKPEKVEKGKEPKQKKAKEPKEPKPKKEKKKAEKKQKPEKPAPEMTESLDLEIRFIRRYVGLHGKKWKKEQIYSFISSLQKAILERKIRKTSKFADVITEIQENIVKVYNSMDNSIKIEIDNTKLEYLKSISENIKVIPAISFIKRFITLYKTPTNNKAQRLYNEIEKAIKSEKIKTTCKYWNELDEVKKSLKHYLENSKFNKLSEYLLNGLRGINGLGAITESPENQYFENFVEKLIKKSNEKQVQRKPTLSGIEPDNEKKNYRSDLKNAPAIINSVELASMNFKKAGYTGKWLKLIGDPVEPFAMMIWSKPGKGKSTLAIELAVYLAENKGKKIIYISKDEGNKSYTMQEKFQRLNAFHKNIEISDGTIPNNLEQYDYVVFDLMNDFNFTYEKFKFDYIEKYKNKGVSFICIFKSTVNGNYRGAKDWENMFDVSININDEGYAQAQKNRFGAFGVIKFLQGNTEKIYKFSNLQDAERFANKQKEKNEAETNLCKGNDGKIWVITPQYAEILQEQGFEKF